MITCTHVLPQNITTSKRESIFQSISARVDFIAHLFKETSLSSDSPLPIFFSVHASGISLTSKRICVTGLYIVRIYITNLYSIENKFQYNFLKMWHLQFSTSTQSSILDMLFETTRISQKLIEVANFYFTFLSASDFFFHNLSRSAISSYIFLQTKKVWIIYSILFIPK